MLKVYTWMGKGVLRHNNRFYGEGDPLPSDFPKESLDRGIKNGTIVLMPEIEEMFDPDGDEDPAVALAEQEVEATAKELEKQKNSLANADTERKETNAKLRVEKAQADHDQAIEDLKVLQEGDED